MPIYEYACQSCGATFDQLWLTVRAAAEAAAAGKQPPCPACGEVDTQRIVSQVAVLGELGGLTPGEQRASNAQETARAERMSSFLPKEQVQQFQANRQKKRESGK
ncbi:MAG: zinc ribbon domain-containing protein [Chloroflexi bacterium]|nr:zinc ribbon domain-containing protein [Chloroflexota bacterium]